MRGVRHLEANGLASWMVPWPIGIRAEFRCFAVRDLCILRASLDKRGNMAKSDALRGAVSKSVSRLLLTCLAVLGLSPAAKAVDPSIVARIDAIRSKQRVHSIVRTAPDVRTLSADPAQWGNWGNWNNWNNWANWANWGNWGNWPNY